MLSVKRKWIVPIIVGTLLLSYGIHRLQVWRESGPQNARLLALVRSDDQTGVLSALDNGASSDAVDSARCSALMLAAERGDLDIARALLDSGANANRRDAHGTTALMRAVTSGNPDLVALLIFWKVDVNVRSDNGATALTLAQRMSASIPHEITKMPMSFNQLRQLSRIVQMLQKAGAHG